MKAYEIIKKPLMSEKSYAGIGAKVYTVTVKGHKKSQNTRNGRTVGKTSDIKKAIVTLKADSKPIAFFESLQ